MHRSVWFHNKIIHVIFYKHVHVSTVVTLHRTLTFNNNVGVNKLHYTCSFLSLFRGFLCTLFPNTPKSRPIESGTDSVKNECAYLIQSRIPHSNFQPCTVHMNTGNMQSLSSVCSNFKCSPLCDCYQWVRTGSCKWNPTFIYETNGPSKWVEGVSRNFTAIKEWLTVVVVAVLP